MNDRTNNGTTEVLLMTQRWMYVVAAMLLTVHPTWAADLGRQPVTPPPTSGREEGGTVPVVRAYQGDALIGTQAELDLTWNAVDWAVGGDHFKATTWAPQASVGFGVNDMVDLRACIKVLSATDSETDPSTDVSFTRLGLGARVKFAAGQDFVPYVGGYLNYYILDVDSSSASGMFGLSAEAGVAYVFNEWFAAQLGVQGETSLLNGKISVDGEDERVTLTSLGVGIGVIVLF